MMWKKNNPGRNRGEFELALGMSLHSVFSAIYIKAVLIGVSHSNIETKAYKWAIGCVKSPFVAG